MPPREGIPYAKGMGLNKGNTSGQKITLTEGEWQGLELEMIGKQPAVTIDGKQVVSHLKRTGDQS